MPLTKEQKQREVAAVACQLQANAVVYLTDYKGLTVDQVNDLRQRFRNSGVEYRVVKNTLLRPSHGRRRVATMHCTNIFRALWPWLSAMSLRRLHAS